MNNSTSLKHINNKSSLEFNTNKNKKLNNQNNNKLKLNHRSFWTGLASKYRNNLKNNSSSITLPNYPSEQPIYKTNSNNLTQNSNFNASNSSSSSRVIAMVGNVRTGIGRMILEELVRQKFIVVALIEKNDSNFSKSVQSLTTSPSLFHAFVIENNLFNNEIIQLKDHHHHDSTEINQSNIEFTNNHSKNNLSTKTIKRNSIFKSFPFLHQQKSFTKSLRYLSSTTTGSSTLADSTTELSSHISLNSSSNNNNNPISNNHTNLQDTTTSTSSYSSRSQIIELKNIFQAYRVDTVICSFEPQTLEPPTGPRSKARLEDEKQFGLDASAERTRIERMEQVVLEACLVAGSVHRFSVTVHPTSLGPSDLSPKPTNSIRPHLRSVLSDEFRMTGAPSTIHITEFRWGFLMNDLAFDASLADGVTAENGLGKWLCEPPQSRWLVDFSQRKSWIPVSTSSFPKDSIEKGKQKLRPVCLTLAEDVARFIGLACKLKQPWQWKTGRIVGDCVSGGWEEIIETIEKISKKKLEREYVCLNNLTNGYTSDSSSTDSSLYQPKSSTNSDSIDPKNPKSPSPRSSTSMEDGYKFQDELRSKLAKENQDASSVMMKEFVRVWYTPLPQPPPIRINGNRLGQKSRPRSHLSAIPPRGSFKPQVGENGTLREPTNKLSMLNEQNNTIEIHHNQSHAAPATQSFHPSSDAHISIGQAISTTDLLKPISHITPMNQSSTAVLNSSPSTLDFNFVPKVIVPFNTNSILGNSSSTTPSFTMKQINHDQSSSSSSKSQANSHQPQNNNVLLVVPKTTPQNSFLQRNSTTPESKLGGHHHHHQHSHQSRSFTYPHHPPSLKSSHTSAHNGNHRLPLKSHALSLANNPRDHNRIMRRSPLATRVA